MTDPQHSFDHFLSMRNVLAAILRESQAAFSEIGLGQRAAIASELMERLDSERFRLIVLGEYNRGKSTFINALLGKEILPAVITPCTAIINELKWAIEAHAVLHFKDPLPGKLSAGLPAEVLLHLETYRGQKIPPLTVNVEELNRYVVISDPAKDPNHSIMETPYAKAEIFWPLALLKNSVEIIDSPGLNEHGSRTRITMEYLPQIDAVIFIFLATAFGGQTEFSVIDQDLRAAGHEYLFFVCNQFDQLKRQADRDRIKQFAYDTLSARTAFGRDGIFFTSALDAVIGRDEVNPDLVTRSNIPLVESSLAEFLVKERGRVKLLQPAKQIAQSLKAALHDSIPDQHRMLAGTLESLEQKYQVALPQLNAANKRRNSVVESLNRCRGQLRDAVRQAATSHLRDLADKVPAWAAAVEIEKKVNLFKVWAIEKQVESVAEEIVLGITPLIDNETFLWQEERLKPLIHSHLADFNEQADSLVSEFMVDIEGIRAGLSGASKGGTLLPETNIGAVERVLSTVGGQLLGGPGSAIEGATMGYAGMVRSIVPSLAVVAVGVLALHLNPITIVPALIAMGIFRALRKGDVLTQRVKSQIGSELARLITTKIPEQSASMADSVHEKTADIVEEISSKLDREIKTMQEQVEAVLQIKRAGEKDVDEQRARLQCVEASLRSLDTRLSDFVHQLVYPK